MKTGMNLLLWTTHVTSEHFPLFGKLEQIGKNPKQQNTSCKQDLNSKRKQ
jgi:hypothetical protein